MVGLVKLMGKVKQEAILERASSAIADLSLLDVNAGFFLFLSFSLFFSFS